MHPTLRAALLAGSALLGINTADAATLLALTADNQLIRVDSETRRAAAPVRVTGADGRLVGIDQRPANGTLYGLTDRGQIVTIDPASGRATQVSRLSESFESGGRAVVDFNPAADRLRVMGMNGTSLRINVETGQTIRDGALKYTNADLAGTQPRITAGAYTNSVAGTQSTMLLTIDTALNQLNLQSPPNDGVQSPRARVSVSLPPGTAFDILADGQGGNTGFLLAGGALHRLDLGSGQVTTLGPVQGLGSAEILDVAAMR
jgi:hypothetical protein